MNIAAKITPSLIMRLKRKAANSPSRWRIAAIGFSRLGNVLGIVTNGFLQANILPGKGQGNHAEEELIRRFGKKLASIIICRIGNAGDIRPISPCDKCKALAAKYNIKILSVCE